MNTTKKTLVAGLIVVGGFATLSTFAFNGGMNRGAGRGMHQGMGSGVYMSGDFRGFGSGEGIGMGRGKGFGPHGSGGMFSGCQFSGAFMSGGLMHNPNFQAIQTAMDTKDYATRKKLMDGKGVAEKVDTEAKFLKFIKMETAMRNGDTTTADAIAKELGLGTPRMDGKGMGKLRGRGNMNEGRRNFHTEKSNTGGIHRATGTGARGN